jgi:anti-sigma factor RsiW
MNECDKHKGLLVGLLDGELNAEESRQINEHLIRCAACRADYERLRETSGKLESAGMLEPTDRILAQVWRSPYSRFARVASLLLVIGGYLLLIGYGLVAFLTSGTEALTVKIAVAAMLLGALTLLALVARERLQTYRHDPYREIER